VIEAIRKDNMVRTRGLESYSSPQGFGEFNEGDLSHSYVHTSHGLGPSPHKEDSGGSLA